MTFDEEKAAQAAAYLLLRAGGRLHQLKLMKLLYLAERLSYQEYGFGLTGDRLHAVEHGPVLVRVQALIEGALQLRRGGWSTWVRAPYDYQLELADPAMLRDPSEDLLALSDGDLRVLARVWDDFSRLDLFSLVERTKQLPEVAAADGVIDIATLLSAVGFDDAQVRALVQRLEQQREIDREFA